MAISQFNGVFLYMGYITDNQLHLLVISLVHRLLHGAKFNIMLPCRSSKKSNY